MMTAIGNAELNDLGWEHEHWLGRMHFEKPIEMIVCVLLAHYDLEHALPRYAVEDDDEYKHDQDGEIDNHLERNYHDSLDGHWDGIMIHVDGLIEINLDLRYQSDDDDDVHLGYAESVGVWNLEKLISDEVLGLLGTELRERDC